MTPDRTPQPSPTPGPARPAPRTPGAQVSNTKGQELIAAGFATIDRELNYLVDCFGEVLEDLGEKQLAEHLHNVRTISESSHEPDPPASTQRPHQDHTVPERLAQVDSIWFQLLNMVEESAAQQVRRLRESEMGPDAEPGMWERVLARLRSRGLSAAQIAGALPHVRVEPVLTAHPTEAKPTTVIEQHRAIFRLLEEFSGPIRSDADRRRHREQTKAALERLWRTGEILLQKPDVSAERGSLMFYLREVFPEAVDGLDARLRQAWSATGLAGERPLVTDDLPEIYFGFWAGGDRDGHPRVTHDVTRETFGELRRSAMRIHGRALARLAEKLSLSAVVQRPGEELTRRVEVLGGQHTAAYDTARSRHPHEPWRHLALLMRANLPPDPRHEAQGERASRGYARGAELLADLHLLRRALTAVGATRLAEADVDPMIRRMETFGFHLAKLDIRQNSQYHDTAMAQLLAAANVPEARGWPDWPEDKRLELLNRELAGPRPFARFGRKIGAECDELLATYRVSTSWSDAYGFEGLGPLIVSMTHRLSDLLTVYIFAREAGLARFRVDQERGSGALVCPLPVVPLFETLEDLNNAPALMEAFLSHPVTRASMADRPGRPPSLLTTREATLPVQQVMLGYSDSNKVSGIFAAQWALHRCQEELTRIADARQVRLRFFHGRGGTISRGAGPTHRFLESLPGRSLGGDVRLTEQGETVAQKYANPTTATYNLELLVAGVTNVTLGHRLPRGGGGGGGEASRRPDLAPAAARLAELSDEAYRSLLGHEHFMAFFSEATPIDVLEQSNIGSRPARRTGQRTLDDLRAIPWVFSWNQSRYYLPGWFGTGTALAALQRDDAGLFEALCAGVEEDPFLRYVLTNIETNIASADEELMRAYGSLVTDPAVRDSVLGLVLSEYERTETMLDTVFGGAALHARRPRMVKTLQLREARLRVLHLQQIDLLRRWRPQRDAGSPAADELLPQLLLNVNAIASGLRTTG